MEESCGKQNLGRRRAKPPAPAPPAKPQDDCEIPLLAPRANPPALSPGIPLQRPPPLVSPCRLHLRSGPTALVWVKGEGGAVICRLDVAGAVP
jgi:hypothetical protein